MKPTNKKLLTEFFDKFIKSSVYKFHKKPITTKFNGVYQKTTEISVVNGDCIDIAYNECTKDNKVCLLNMASYLHAGGGVTKGSIAQEEEICRRTNLYTSLTEMEYPLAYYDYFLTKNVVILLDSEYNTLEYKNRKEIDVLSVAAIKMRDFTKSEEIYLHITREKIKQILSVGLINSVDTLVLSAFGCGAYGNDPNVISQIFKEEIENYKYLYKKIIFAIYNDKNSVSDNLTIFKSVIEG